MRSRLAKKIVKDPARYPQQKVVTARRRIVSFVRWDLDFACREQSIIQGARAATKWIELAIRAVREAAEPNKFKDADDETIAGEILKQIAQKEIDRRSIESGPG
jgi:hypothetical protein